MIEVEWLVDEHYYRCLLCSWQSPTFGKRISTKKQDARKEVLKHFEEGHSRLGFMPWRNVKVINHEKYRYNEEEYENFYNDIPEPLVLEALRMAVARSYSKKGVPAYEVSKHLLGYFRNVFHIDHPSYSAEAGHDKVQNALNRLSKRGLIERKVLEVKHAYSYVLNKQRALGQHYGAQGVGTNWKMKVAHFTPMEIEG